MSPNVSCLQLWVGLRGDVSVAARVAMRLIAYWVDCPLATALLQWRIVFLAVTL